MTFRRTLVASALMIVLGVANGVAQVQNGVISGTVKDSQGGALPGATVTLEGDGPSRVFVTEADGQYRFLAVPPGTYKLSASLQGFQGFVDSVDFYDT